VSTEVSGCEEWAEEIALYGEGELAAERAAAVQAHLDACPACRAEAAAWHALDRVLARGLAPSEQAPPGFAAQIAAGVRRLDPVWARPRVAVTLGARQAWPLALALAIAALLLPLRWPAVPWQTAQAWSGTARSEARATAEDAAALVAQTPDVLRTTYADWPSSMTAEAAALLGALRSTWAEATGGWGAGLVAGLLLLLLAANGKLARDALRSTALAGR